MRASHDAGEDKRSITPHLTQETLHLISGLEKPAVPMFGLVT